MKKQQTQRVKVIINIVTIAALIGLIYISRHAIVDAFNQRENLNIYALGLMIPLQLISYYAVAKFYRNFFAKQGENVSLKEMYKVALELNFVNHVFPSGGVSGFSYLSLRLKQQGISTAKSTLAQILRFGLTFLSFLIVLLFALFMLAVGETASGISILISTLIIVGTIFGTAVGVFIISSPKRIKAFVSWLPKAVNYIVRPFKKDKSSSLINIHRVENTLDDLHNDYVVLSKDIPLVKNLLKWSLVLNMAEVATIYVVYIALGQLINPGALIIAYAVANFAGLIAVLPGGVGIYEGLMTATLTSAGVPKALALSATVIYRVLSMLLSLPVGYYFYHQALKHGGPSTKQLEHSGDVADA